jgi:predicted nucleic acid-binding protein
MTEDYFDSSVLVPLYVEDDVFSRRASVFVEHFAPVIAICPLQRAEFENAVRLKVFRKEILSEDAVFAFQHFANGFADGRLVRRDVNWPAAFAGVTDVSRRVTEKTGCRTLDLLHVAVAVQWGCRRFVSADERQLAAAQRMGFETADLRL